ncbi:nitric oxide reductase transcriptional regulator NorR [Thalassotalea euphylliae]|uniref:Nitric oxide reductase transcriptional regulator NorR n=1 Tax=Thalassotalea euphylliae TaxID=1655234 RepID=A0A3E0ULH8_9GAMM|nr:nitric oxide reductase transcriptional regulator NorR [Thalassotalea euphylliae]REL37344.1 nitric oxide reductase transcriptional regulator NorR [Thalassotalea euphylliae]
MNNLADNQLLELSIELAQSAAKEQRFDDVLTAIRKVITCDAIALLVIKGDYLQPIASQGLSADTMGRRFVIDEHPRFSQICTAREAIRFAADSPLPDPYDGLLSSKEGDLPIHACMGLPLYFDEHLIGVLTLDSLTPNIFNGLSERALSLVSAMVAVNLHTALTLNSLESNINHSKAVMRAINEPSISGVHTELIGQSPSMEKLNHEISMVAPSNYSVLIEGESGTGKELIAHSIHQQSSRSEAAIIHVNCAALPENLIESELFGHVKGAFTGANSKRAGKFVIADGGTIFLDEVGELPLAAQSKLLRVLQSQEVQPVGQDEVITVNVRVIAATNRNLKDEVENGRFRADLYHRLNVYPIKVPALRDRHGDVALLAGFFIERAKRKLGVGQLKLSTKLMQQLTHYTWPGNVRELEHLLNRAALKACAKVPAANRYESIVTITDNDSELVAPIGGFSGSKQATEKDLLAASTQTEIGNEFANKHFEQGHFDYKQFDDTPINLRENVDAYQRQLVRRALSLYQGNWSRAAKHLGVDRANLTRLAKRLDIHIDKVVR